MKKIIINADDIGLSEGVNRAVSECVDKKRIQSVSIISTGFAFDHAIKALREYDSLSMGVHLCISGPFSALTGASSITDKNGFFLRDYRLFIARLIAGGVSIDDIKQEYEAQIIKVRNSNIRISHIDSHQHLHMIPAIWNIAAELALRYNIPYMRYVNEPISSLYAEISGRAIAKYTSMRIFTMINSKKYLKPAGLIFNDYLWGYVNSGHMTSKRIEKCILNINGGINEIVLHPAYVNKELLSISPWHINAEKELADVLEGDWYKRLLQPGLYVTNHNEFASGANINREDQK